VAPVGGAGRPDPAPGGNGRNGGGRGPAPVRSGDRIPVPGPGGGRGPAPAPTRSGDRIPPPGRSGDGIPAPAPTRSGDRIPAPGRSGDGIPAPGRSGDRIPAPGRSGDGIPPAPGLRRPPPGDWPPGAPGTKAGPKGKAGAKVKAGAKGAKGKATGKNAKNAKHARNPKNARNARNARRKPVAPAKPKKTTGGLAPVYDIEGPRVRLGVAWFLGAAVTVAASPFTAAACYAIAAGFAARQIVRAWKCVPWQADVAAGLAAAVVLASALGTMPAVAVAVLAVLAVVGLAAAHPEGGRIRGAQGRVATILIMVMALIPALGGVTLTLTRAQDVTAAVTLLLLVSAYEAADYIIGSGASNFIEGPLAGITTALVLGLPLALVLIPPFDDAGWQLLVFLALTLPLGQIMASVLLPRAGANAPALRRVDTLLLLAPIWAAAASAF
jgi:hypothetical protein